MVPGPPSQHLFFFHNFKSNNTETYNNPFSMSELTATIYKSHNTAARHTTWGADQQTLLHLYRSLIRFKLDYGCVVYGSARSSYLRVLDPVQNHAIRLCLGACRTSPSSSLCVLANEPPPYLRRKKLSMQHRLKLSATSQNPAYSAVFAGRFKSFFDNKPNQIPTIRVQTDLQAIGFEQRNTLQCSIPATAPWLFSHPCVNFELHRFYKDNTAPDIFRSMFYEICTSYDNFDHIYTDGLLGSHISLCAYDPRGQPGWGSALGPCLTPHFNAILI